MSAIFLGISPGRIHTYSSDGAIAQNAFGTLVWAMVCKTNWKNQTKNSVLLVYVHILHRNKSPYHPTEYQVKFYLDTYIY